MGRRGPSTASTDAGDGARAQVTGTRVPAAGIGAGVVDVAEMDLAHLRVPETA